MWFWYQCDTSWRFPPSAIFWKNLQMIAVSSSLDDKFAFEAIWSWNFVLWKLLNYGSGSDGKESACNAGDLGLIRGSGRSPVERNGYPLQYSCLENPMDRRAWWATVQGVGKGHDWAINFNQNILKYYCYLKCQFSFVGKNAVCKHFVHFLPCILKLRWSQTFGSGDQLDNFSFHH